MAQRRKELPKEPKDLTKPLPEKKWTLMFYFASDNPIAPAVVSQLKALKNAGYHDQANVLAYFDPETVLTPTHVFDVNLVEKLNDPGGSQIGFNPADPFVRNLMLDKLWGDEEARNGETIRKQIKELILPSGALDRPKPPRMSDDETVPQAQENTEAGAKKAKPGGRPDLPSGPELSLDTFLNFCATYYPAEHYMLFIIGHGLIVGNDVFLFDQHAARHSLTLQGLGKLLKKFKRHENVRRSDFDLVSFHSCSMSSLELASELKGTAKYMVASQGSAYVGSWPYLSILIRVFNDLKTKDATDVEETIKKIFFYIRHNSTDFLLAGYSFDLCLCNLSPKCVERAELAIKELAKELKSGLADSAPALVRDCILLAHWRSQSFFQENYTDMYDFCLCLDFYCTQLGARVGNMSAIQKAAGKVMDALMPQNRAHPDQLVVISQFVGPDSQYSHGVSVFFPWSEPTRDRPIMRDYKEYVFQKKTGWLTFLKTYFDKTMRQSRRDEPDSRVNRRTQSALDKLREDMAAIMFGASGAVGAGALASPDKTGPHDPLGQHGPRDPLGSTGPRDPMGDGCVCGSIKNFPHDTRPRRKRIKSAYREGEGPIYFPLEFRDPGP